MSSSYDSDDDDATRQPLRIIGPDDDPTDPVTAAVAAPALLSPLSPPNVVLSESLTSPDAPLTSPPAFHSAPPTPAAAGSASQTQAQQQPQLPHSPQSPLHAHPSEDQEVAERTDGAHGHSHTKSAHEVSVEGDAVNARAPWADEAAQVAAVRGTHSSSPVHTLPPLDERKAGVDAVEVEPEPEAEAATDAGADASPSPSPSSSAPEPSPSPSSPVSSPAPNGVALSTSSQVADASSYPRSSVDLGIESVSINRRASAQKRMAELARVDRWGNIREESSSTPSTPAESKARAKRLELDQERESKWVRMVARWDRTVRDKSDKLKRRIRKGIPDSIRAAVWPKLTGAEHMMRHAAPPGLPSSSPLAHTGPGVYARYAGMHSREQDTIARDIARTFPRHVLFRDQVPDSDPAGVGDNISRSGPSGSIGGGGAGQGLAKGADYEGKNSPGRSALFNVLKAYSLHDESVGYCQGMGFPAGLFLMYLTEEESFWMLCAIARGEKYLLHGMWSPGFPLLFQCFYQFQALLKKSDATQHSFYVQQPCDSRHCPRLSSHLLSQEPSIVPELYATHWFMTLWSYNLPFDVVLRIWDVLLAEGSKIIFRVAIFVCQQVEKEILKEREFGPILDILKNVHKHPMMSDPDFVIDGALKIKISRSELSALASAFQEQKFREEQEKQRRRQEEKAAK